MSTVIKRWKFDDIFIHFSSFIVASFLVCTLSFFVALLNWNLDALGLGLLNHIYEKIVSFLFKSNAIVYSCFRVLQADPVRSGHVLPLNTVLFNTWGEAYCQLYILVLSICLSMHLLDAKLTDAKIAIQVNRRAILATS